MWQILLKLKGQQSFLNPYTFRLAQVEIETDGCHTFNADSSDYMILIYVCITFNDRNRVELYFIFMS